ncbi:MAG TPA: hypothetical protein VEZ11_19060 [Thermoanaerobaculia bacterium]|nr:hypothetical protein [Thermoanaerobaculia bacterium]
MTKHRFIILAVVATLASAGLSPVRADCVNRFVAHGEGMRQVFTLLTGKLTYQEAQALAQAMADKKAPVIEWVDDGGKTIAKQFGELKVLRPMPVGCDGRTSGVVLTVQFPTSTKPAKKVFLKLDPNATVAFEEQGN